MNNTFKIKVSEEVKEKFKTAVYTSPVLNAVAMKLADNLCHEINSLAALINEPRMPYKAQYILEQVIKILEKRV